MGITMTITESTEPAVQSPVLPDFVERRHNPRYQFTATAELVDLQSRAKIQARTSDLSRGGCYIDTTNPLPVDATVRMRLTQDNRSFEAEARVVYSLTGMGMGVKFMDATPEHMGVLESWIGELSGEAPLQLSASERSEPACGAKGSGHDQSYVLSTLVLELVRTGVLSQEKGKTMLNQLLGSNS
jgi:hypothetical protein